MDIAQVFDIMSGLAMMFLTLCGIWVRKLLDEVAYIKSSLKGMQDANDREHGGVMESVSHLSKELTTEVRGIVLQHAEHDKEMVRIACKLDRIVESTK